MDARHYPIIIVGAGPTGLMLAAQLYRQGASFLILDKKGGPTTESRALVVQARSMEIYEQMGLVDRVIKEGKPARGISLYKKGKPVASINLRNMGDKISPFPYAMVYEQSCNEHLLNDYLQSVHQSVEWNTGVNQIEEKEGLYFLQTTQGLFSCRYLVACDGGGSTVRNYAGMSFEGGTYENVFYVADTHVRGTGYEGDMLALFLVKDTLSFLFPMTGENRFRVMGILPKEYYYRDDIRFEELVDRVKANTQLPLEFYDTSWYSTYRLHHKKVAHFNKGNIFFAGDAAHVHSPAGGQGMNTGLQDAYNLAWKLALVSSGQASAPLLDTYHEERNPVAERLLKTTDRLFSIMVRSAPPIRFIKMFVVPRVIPLVSRFAAMRKRWFLEVSQTQINYRASSLSGGKAGRISAGERFPFFQVGGQSVYQWIRERGAKGFLVVTYGMDEAPGALPTAVPGAQPAATHAQQPVATHAALPSGNDATLKEAGFPPVFIVVLRPDNYIAYIAETFDKEAINRFMREHYHLTGSFWQ